MLNRLLLILSVLIATQARAAYVVALVADEKNLARASAMIEKFKGIAPFGNLMAQRYIEFVVVPAEAQKLACKAGQEIRRASECDHDYPVKLAEKVHADRVLIVTDMVNGGVMRDGIGMIGTGGFLRKMESALNNRPFEGTLIHELLHTWGFADEYKLDKKQALAYCKEFTGSVNVIVLEDKIYASDQQARAQLSSQIPWFDQIDASTPITHDSKLGTSIKAKVGLFRSPLCDNAQPPLATWTATQEVTIMKVANTYIPKVYWPVIYQAIGAPWPPSGVAEKTKPKSEQRIPAKAH